MVSTDASEARAILGRFLVAAVILVSGLVTVAAESDATVVAPGITAERNTELSGLVGRLELVSTAGADRGSGQYLVRIFRVPIGEECDVPTDLCRGSDLLVSVASLDLYGDHALYRFTGLERWEFRGWESYAEFDNREHFTSFRVAITTRDGGEFRGCGGGAAPSESGILVRVNPWEVACEPDPLRR